MPPTLRKSNMKTSRKAKYLSTFLTALDSSLNLKDRRKTLLVYSFVLNHLIST
jgi:hypothetical protein